MKFLIKLLLPIIFVVFSANSQEGAKRPQAVPKQSAKETEKKSAKGGRASTLPIFKDGATSIKNPLDMRDPFKRKRRKIGVRSKTYGGFLKNNKYSNLPTINEFPLNKIRIVGVLLGKNRRAIAKVVIGQANLSPETYIIKEGMVIGENDAEVRAIVPGGIVLVEKIRNVYDQDEYIETIIPVSSEVL